MEDLAEQVLDHFRDRFINVIDANAIVMELQHCDIISDGDQTEVRHETNPTQQNQLLYRCLEKKCTVKALMVVCDVITKVGGNPKLKSLGEDMKTKLETGIRKRPPSAENATQSKEKHGSHSGLPRKRRRPSTQGSEDLELQEPVAKKLVHNYTALRRDHLVQDISDLRSESDPKVIIKLLYYNALDTISRLLKPHLKDVKKAAYGLNDLELHHVAVDEGIIESADSIDSLLRQMSVTKMWHETRFLRKAIASIQQSASDREVAEAILFHYDQHLAIYKRATCLKDAISKDSETEEEAKVPVESNELVPLKITSRKDFNSFSCEDCYILQVRGLKKAYGIPEEKIICREVKDGHSTTITFLIPRQYSHDVIQRSGRLDTIWILLELDIIEVSIPGVFTFIPSVGCFLAQLRGSNPFTADLLGVTEVLPYQTYCLLDPDTKEPLSGRRLSTKRIEQHWDSHGKRKQPQSAEGASQSKKLYDSPSGTPKHPVDRAGSQVVQTKGVKNQGITASPHSKVHFGRWPVLLTFVCLAMLIPLVGVNDWQHRMCPSGIPWAWSCEQSDTCTAADLIQVSELHTDLTKEDLRYLQSVGQNDLVWVGISITGVGKSTLGNFLLGKDAFKVGSALISVTEKAEMDCSAVNDQCICFVDTPGFSHTRHWLTKNTEAENLANDAAPLIVELSRTMLMAKHGINAFIVVVRADSRELFSTMKLLDLLDILGNYWNHSILVFTHGKEFDQTSEERQYAKFEAMLESPSCPDVWRALMGKVSNRYIIVEPEEWKDDKEYRLQKLTEFRKHTSRIMANSGLYSDTLHSLVRKNIETAKLELRHKFSNVDSPEAQVAALQVAFKNITPMFDKLIRIKLAGGVDTELEKAKKEQLTKVLLYQQLLEEQEEKRRKQAEVEKTREKERKAKESERVMAEEGRLALERGEKLRKELEELQKLTFAERRIEMKITRSEFCAWAYAHTAEAVDVATMIRGKGISYTSEAGAKEHAKASLKTTLMEQGIIPVFSYF